MALLFKKTALQSTFGAILLALDGGRQPEEFTLKAVGNCRRALMSGVTSARDVGARHAININIARQSAAGAILGPRIIASGEWFQFPGTRARRADQDH